MTTDYIPFIVKGQTPDGYDVFLMNDGLASKQAAASVRSEAAARSIANMFNNPSFHKARHGDVGLAKFKWRAVPALEQLRG